MASLIFDCRLFLYTEAEWFSHQGAVPATLWRNNLQSLQTNSLLFHKGLPCFHARLQPACHITEYSIICHLKYWWHIWVHWQDLCGKLCCLGPPVKTFQPICLELLPRMHLEELGWSQICSVNQKSVKPGTAKGMSTVNNIFYLLDSLHHAKSSLIWVFSNIENCAYDTESFC